MAKSGKGAVVRLRNNRTREEWAAEITAGWQKQLESIFVTGLNLETAQAELPHGEWIKMIQEELPFKRHTAARLQSIANNANLRDGAHGLHLPACWRTLYELTKLTDEQFAVGIKSGAIHPGMQRKDAVALREPTRAATGPSRGDAISACYFSVQARIEKTLKKLELPMRGDFLQSLQVMLEQLKATIPSDESAKP